MQENIWIDDSPVVYTDAMHDLRQRLGYDKYDTNADEKILAMSGHEFLEEYMSWNGIIGYADMIIEAVYMAYGIDLNEYPFDRDIKRTAEED